MSKELTNAFLEAKRALEDAQLIAGLPSEVGSQIQWSNGLVWTRAGDDDWRSSHFPRRETPSKHVATSADWRTL